MYIYIPHNTPSLFVLKFCISSYFQKLFRKYSVLPIVYVERGQTAGVLWGTQIIAQGAPKIFLSTYNRTSTILNLVVRYPRVFVQKVLLKTQKKSGIYIIKNIMGRKTNP